MKIQVFAVAAASLLASADAWATPRATSVAHSDLLSQRASTSSGKIAPLAASFDPLNLAESTENDGTGTDIGINAITQRNPAISPAMMAAVVLGTPGMATAATAFAPNAVGAALAAYGHYISILGLVACTVIERFTIKPNMSEEDETVAVIADVGLGVWGALMAYTGYLRATQYEKGFAFYSHEPIFWLKITFVAIYGAATFFNTVTLVKRGIDKSNGTLEPMSEELAERMIRLCNAELTALAIIPLTATFVARGIGYSNDLPWQPLAGFAAVAFLGAGFKYIKEALDFENKPAISE